MAEFIRVEIRDREVRAALTRLHGRLRDRRPYLKAAGEILVEGTRDRFKTMTDPEGEPWKALSPGYRAAKKKNRDRILVLRGDLEGSIRYQVEGSDTLLVGTNTPYAAIHQFGGRTGAHTIRARAKKALFWPGAAHPVKSVHHPGSNIPARPFLGIGDRDRVRLLEAAEFYLKKAVEG